jgi:hypothetical protein
LATESSRTTINETRCPSLGAADAGTATSAARNASANAADEIFLIEDLLGTMVYEPAAERAGAALVGSHVFAFAKHAKRARSTPTPKLRRAGIAGPSVHRLPLPRKAERPLGRPLEGKNWGGWVARVVPYCDVSSLPLKG